MPRLILILLFFLLSFGTQAQAPATPAQTPVATIPAPKRFELSTGRRDTLSAIGNLYARRRRGGTVWILIGTGFTAAIARGLAAGNTGGNAAGGIASIAVLGGLPIAIGVSKKVRFSEAKENEVDRAYRSGQPLPRRIARKLAKKDFE